MGGGTTDLSLVDIREEDKEAHPGQRDVRIHVAINAGVPVGGTDVDKLLLRAAISPEANTAEKLAVLDQGARHWLLTEIRKQKQSDAEPFFWPQEDSEKDEIFKTKLRSVLERLETATKTVTLARGPEGESTTAAFRKEANLRMDNLVQLSIVGLFNLIPAFEKRGVTKILLTGRASQLKQIRDAVIQEANSLGAEVLSLIHPYHLKLAVAYGCALVRDDEFSGAKLPSGTLGRKLRVVGSGNRPLAEFNGDLPVSSIAPTLWVVTCPSPDDNPVRYEVCEFSTSVPLEFSVDYSLDEMMWLGCFRSAAEWVVGIRGAGGAFQRVLLARCPKTESYYSVNIQGALPKWQEPELEGFDLEGINLITGLPLGFPNEVPQ